MTGQDLRQRAQQHTNGDGDNGGEVARRDQPATVAQMIDAQRGALARALPKHLDADRLARIAITVVKQTPKLGECEPMSLLGALMTAAQLGLEPGPLGEAYLVPFKNTTRNRMEVQFICGYRGMVKLAWQSGQLKSLQAYVVHERDDFDYAYGLNPSIEHKPYDGDDDPGKLTYAYAVAKFKDGGDSFVVLNRRDIEAARARSQSGNDQGRNGSTGPWKTDYAAMARKTAVRQLERWLPKSPELLAFRQAAARDESVRLDFDSPLDESNTEVVDGEVVAETGDQAATGEAPHDPDAQAQAEADAEKARAAEATS